ncbi:hypothetical protein AAG906_019813 [Vitis piasezkii]
MAGDDAQKLVEHGKHSNPSRTTEPWENSNHPLFLHHSDQPAPRVCRWHPQQPTHNPNEQQEWDRCNILVKTWLWEPYRRNLQQCYPRKDAITMTVSYVIFTKLKGLWDEKDALCGFPPCTCATAAEVKTYMETQKTMKFLMGLGDNYATVRSNIIGMDPLPTVNKAYAMALRHEKQAEASNGKVVVPNEGSQM